MNGSRQRLAWAFLILSFFVCAATVLAVPLGANLLRQRAMRPMVVTAQTNQGTLAMVRADGETAALLSTDSAVESDVPVELITNAADTGLLQLFAPNSAELVGRIQLYGNTNLQLQSAETPRFTSSTAARQTDLALTSGRVRLTVPPHADRVTEFRVTTQQGAVSVREAGQYFIEASNVGTQVSVADGTAWLGDDGGDELSLSSGQRGVLHLDSPPSGPFDTARNIIRNGGFDDSMAEWVASTWNVELGDQPGGELRVTQVNDENVLRVDRIGLGHADAAVRQIVDQDVSAYESLRLLVSMRFLNQSLPVCGSLGTECPLTVRIEYVDANGQSQVWQQGLYAIGDPSTAAPNFCSVCGYPLNQNEHWDANRVGEVVFYESDNLIGLWSQEGSRPVEIKSVSLVAAGHSFTYDVIDVALMAEQEAPPPEETGAILPGPDATRPSQSIQ